MNEFIFVEEENTFYEIDKECQLAMANHRENENCQDEMRKDNFENRRTGNVRRIGNRRCQEMEPGLKIEESSRRRKNGCSLCPVLILAYLLSLSRSSKKLG